MSCIVSSRTTMGQKKNYLKKLRPLENRFTNVLEFSSLFCLDWTILKPFIQLLKHLIYVCIDLTFLSSKARLLQLHTVQFLPAASLFILMVHRWLLGTFYAIVRVLNKTKGGSWTRKVSMSKFSQIWIIFGNYLAIFGHDFFLVELGKKLKRCVGLVLRVALSKRWIIRPGNY